MSATLTIILLTFSRDDALASTLRRIQSKLGTSGFQLILVDNNPADQDRMKLLETFEDSLYLNEGYNMGVAAGRNRGIHSATGELILFLDDDALLEVDTEFSDKLDALFGADPKLAAVAFRSFVGDARIEEAKEFPHTDKTKDKSKDFDTFRFIGVAHVIRAAALKQAGHYCPSFFYGMEEFDLAFRFLKLGYRIQYRPEFVVQHMKSTDGRLASSAVTRRMYANKLCVGWMHLPMGTFLKSAVAWFVKTAIDARNPLTPFKAVGDFLAMVSHGQVERRRPSVALVHEVRRLGGNPWR